MVAKIKNNGSGEEGIKPSFSYGRASAAGFSMFPLSDSGYAGTFQDKCIDMG